MEIISHDKPQNEQDTTVTRFNSVMTDQQTAMKSRFTPSEEVDHLKWIGFLIFLKGICVLGQVEWKLYTSRNSYREQLRKNHQL